jgi:hypothetical protein
LNSIRRLQLLLLLVLGLSATGEAQQLQPFELNENPRQERSASSTTAIAAASSNQQPTARPPERRRRRPSMVGYINDAGIQSQMRVRLDFATENDTPDRAEFFYAKCGCFRDAPATDPTFDPDARGPGPGLGTVVDFRQFYLQLEYAFGDRFSVYGELPFRWIEPDPQAFVAGTGSFGNQGGVSDLRIGVKAALVASERRMLTAQLQGILPTGDGRKGLGTEHGSIEPALLYNEALGERGAFEAQFGVVIPTDGSRGLFDDSDKYSGSVLYYGFGPSVELYRSEALSFAPVVELVGWYVLGGYQSPEMTEAEGVTVVNLKLGARFEFAARNSIYAGYGFALTDDVWYDDVLRVEYRVTF